MSGREPASLSPFALFSLWASLGATLYIMPFGSLLVPALSIERAVAASLIGSLLAALLVGAIGAIAARRSEGTLGLLQLTFGPQARLPLAALLVVRNVAWAALALSLIAGSAELVTERALGEGLRPLWVLAFGGAGLAFVLAGPRFIAGIFRRGALALVFLIAAAITLSAYAEFEVPSYLRRPAAGGWPEFWQAVDVMMIVPLLWLPVVADFGRLSRRRWNPAMPIALGLFVGSIWFAVLGIVYLPAVGSQDVPGFVVGMNLSLAALAIILVLQVDELFASGYSGAMAIEAIRPAGRAAPMLVGGAAIALTLVFDFVQMEQSLLLLASAFVPLFGVVLADEVLSRAGIARSTAISLAAWTLGFLAYQWIAPPDAGWWLNAASWFFADLLSLPFPLSQEVTWLGAAVGSLFLAFAARSLGGLLSTLVSGKKEQPAHAGA